MDGILSPNAFLRTHSYTTGHSNHVSQTTFANSNPGDTVQFSPESSEDDVEQDGYHNWAALTGSHDSVKEGSDSDTVTANGSHDDIEVGKSSNNDHITVNGSNQNVSVTGADITATYKNGHWQASGADGKVNVTQRGAKTIIAYQKPSSPPALHS